MYLAKPLRAAWVMDQTGGGLGTRGGNPLVIVPTPPPGERAPAPGVEGESGADVVVVAPGACDVGVDAGKAARGSKMTKARSSFVLLLLLLLLLDGDGEGEGMKGLPIETKLHRIDGVEGRRAGEAKASAPALIPPLCTLSLTTLPHPFILGQATLRMWLFTTPAIPPRSSTEMGTLYHVSRSNICRMTPKHS